MSHKTLDEYLKPQQTKTIEKQHQPQQEREEPKYRITGFYRETQFQGTEIGKIPKEWKVVELGKNASIVNGYTFPLEFQGKKSGKYPFIKVGDMNNSYKYIDKADNYVDEEDLASLKARPFPKGTIIFPKIGMAMRLNKYRILGCEAIFDNNVAGVIVNNKDVNNEFLYYYFEGKVNLITLAGTTTVPSITKSRLERLLIPLPPLEEQWGVAEVLSSVDCAIEAIDKLIQKLEHVKKTLMQKLLTKGIGHKEFQETSIGKIPKTWRIIKLSQIVQIKHGKRPKELLNDGFPVYGAGGLAGYTSKYLVDNPYVIIIARVGVGSVGKVYLAQGKVWVNDNALYFIVNNKEVNPVFLHYALAHKKLERLARRGAGGYAILTQSTLENMPVALPPLEEQTLIANTLRSIDNWIELEVKRKERFERLKSSLMNLLLGGKVRVVVG